MRGESPRAPVLSPASAEAHPCHGHAASRRWPTYPPTLPRGCCHPPCRLPTRPPACPPVHLPARQPASQPSCLPASLHGGSPALRRSTDRRRAHHASRRAASRRVPSPDHLPTTCPRRDCRADRLPCLPVARRAAVPPACLPVCLPACLPACLPTASPRLRRIAGVPSMPRAAWRIAACRRLPPPPPSALPPPCRHAARHAARRAAHHAASAVLRPPPSALRRLSPPRAQRTAGAPFARRNAGVCHLPVPCPCCHAAADARRIAGAPPGALPCRLPARLPTASHGGSPAPSTLGGSPACLPCLLRSESPRASVLSRPMPKPAPATAPRRSAGARRATTSRAACLPALSCRFATLGDAPAVFATSCPLPRRPDPATNEPTRRPLAATGCPASPPPRRCLAATCTCLPPVCLRVLSLPSLLLPFLFPLACRLRKRPVLLKMPSTLRSDLPSCRPSALADLATKTIAAPAGLWRFLLHRSQLALSSAAVRRCQFRQIPCLLEASQAFQKKTDGRRRALVCRLTAPCRSSGARGCKAVLSSFHERAACSWLVVLRAGVMRGNPPTAAVRRSRSRITLASKARLPDPRLLSHRTPPRAQELLVWSPPLEEVSGKMWRAVAVIARISPTTSDMSLGPWRDTLMTTPFAHARGARNDAPPIRGALPVPSGTYLGYACLPACRLARRIAGARNAQKDWGARRIAACPSPFAC